MIRLGTEVKGGFMKNISKFKSEDFKTSSLCNNCASCVEVAYKGGVIAVRDTKNKEQAPLFFDKDEWNAFIGGVKKGEFDL